MTGRRATLAQAGMVDAGMADSRTCLLAFADLRGWAEDDHAAALATFYATCDDMTGPDWRAACADARAQSDVDPRILFEALFRPVSITDGRPMLFTGYYEAELRGARAPGGRYRYPLYRPPADLADLPGGTPWHTRAEIETGGHLDGRGLEIAWVDDPLDVYFLQVQGSGRVRMDDGTTLRVGFGGRNGHPYRSIGDELVRRGVYRPHEVSADAIREWIRDDPQAGVALMRHNPSYVFFRDVSEVPADRGPLGAMSRSITPLRTIAVDPAYVPLGAPVWIERDGASEDGGPMRRLMVAQDTGSAIKGAQRADIFFGTGEAAGRAAGRVRDGGRMVVLMPVRRALALARAA